MSRPSARPSASSSANSSYRRPDGANADGAPTVRNIIPWKDMERKVAERLAARAAAGELDDEGLPKDSHDVPAREPPPWKKGVEPAPDSGVRTSADEGPLTYSVYTVADLAARGDARSPRMSMAFAPPLVPPSRWADAGRAALAVISAWWTCVHAPKPRPRVLDVCRVPLQSFKTTLRALPWKSAGLRLGVAFGALLVLLFVVLTAAELTDDLKPARVQADNGNVSGGASTASLPPNAETAAVPLEPAIELDDDVPSPAVAAAVATPKPRTGKPPDKKKDVELFNP